MLKKYIAILAVICVYSCTTDDPIQEPVANIFDGDAELVTQQAVEDFGAMAYTGITGNLILSTQFENPDPIFSLSSLSTIETIGGDLNIHNLYDLTSLDGLQNLTSVTGALSLIGNSNITSLDAFSNINSTITLLEINSYREIETLQGLENISLASGGSLVIEGNDSLENLDAIQAGLPSVMEVIRFQEFFYQCGPFISCNGLPPPEPQPFTSLTFLSNVTEVEWLRLKSFQGSNLNGLENITAIHRLSVWLTPNLTGLQGLSNVTSDILFAFISQNDQLESLDGLENVSSITGSINVSYNPILNDLCAIQNSIIGLSEEDVEVLFNDFNPTQQDIIDGNCSN